MAGCLLEIGQSLEFTFAKVSRQPAFFYSEINRFLDSQDKSHPFQLPLWAGHGTRLATLRGCTLEWFAQGGVSYPAGRFLPFIRALTVNHGPVCDDLAVLEAGLLQLVDEARKRGFSYIDIAPEWSGPSAEAATSVLVRNGWQALGESRLSLRLDLQPSLDDLLASFRATTRYKIRRSEAAAINVTIAHDESEFRDFVQLYLNMARQKGFGAESPDFLRKVFNGLAADRGRGGLFIAREKGVLKGAILVLRCGARCWYILGATSKDSKFTAGHLLQWRAIQWAKENGCLEYDFCGYRENMTSGPAYFKRGFCDRVVRFVAPHRYIIDRNRRVLADTIVNLRSSLRFPVLKRLHSTGEVAHPGARF